MTKTIRSAAVIAISATMCFAEVNVENPLFAPERMQFYSKTGFGLMYKKVDDTEANRKAGTVGKEEYPKRIYEELGFGILDNLSVNAAFGYTHNGDRKGMHVGRAGLDFRAFDGTALPFVWDVYAHAQLGGISAMSGSYSSVKGFKYDNYTNGRWGVIGGTRVGKQMDKFSVAGFFELLTTFGSDNNEIDLRPLKQEANAGLAQLGGAATIAACLAGSDNPNCPQIIAGFQQSAAAQQAFGMATLPDEVKVNLKGTTEISAGVKAGYQINDMFSAGAHFIFKQRADNGAESVSTKPENDTQKATMEAMAKQLSNMNDGFNEYILGLSGAAQIMPNLQTVLFFEYTFDTANEGSQNGTDSKAEFGLRVNVNF